MDGKEAVPLMYRAVDEDVSVNALIKDESIWLSQKGMAGLFDVSTSSISRHLKNIFEEGELDEKVVIAEIATTTPHSAMEGKTQTKSVMFYNLDAIISAGYWKVLKKRLKDEGSQLVTECNQLKLQSPKDGKRYQTDVATTEQILRILNTKFY